MARLASRHLKVNVIFPKPGDDIIKNPMHVATRAVTIKTRSAEIWPWLVQMGYKRGGMYSYDWIDRLLGVLDGPRAERIIPEFQHLEVGDVVPMLGIKQRAEALVEQREE
jgi:hypothetical protein